MLRRRLRLQLPDKNNRFFWECLCESLSFQAYYLPLLFLRKYNHRQHPGEERDRRHVSDLMAESSDVFLRPS
jgi:hypothetical protein